MRIIRFFTRFTGDFTPTTVPQKIDNFLSSTQSPGVAKKDAGRLE